MLHLVRCFLIVIQYVVSDINTHKLSFDKVITLTKLKLNFALCGNLSKKRRSNCKKRIQLKSSKY